MKTIAINNAKTLAKMNPKSKEFKSKVHEIYKVVNPEYKIGDDTTEWVAFKKAIIKALNDETNFVFKDINIVGIAKTKSEPKAETEPKAKPDNKPEPKAEPKTEIANTKSEPKTKTDATTDVKSELVKSIAIDLANGKMTIEQKLEALRLLANI